MRTVRALLLLLVAITGVPTALGDSATTSMNVSVQVIARTILTIDRVPEVVTVTTQDIARGYVEIPAAIAFRVRSNARNGYSVQFEPVGYPFTKADIAWDSQLAVVSADGSWLTRSYEAGERAGLLSVRLGLSEYAAPGTYAWPVRFDANSI